MPERHDWHAELWIDDANCVATYRWVWETFSAAAVFGAEAQQEIARVRRGLEGVEGSAL